MRRDILGGVREQVRFEHALQGQDEEVLDTCVRRQQESPPPLAADGAAAARQQRGVAAALAAPGLWSAV